MLSQFKEELKNKWPHHLISFLIGLSLLGLGYFAVKSVVISGHAYESIEVFNKSKFSHNKLISKKIEVGDSGDIHSFFLRINSPRNGEQISLYFESSFDGETWLSALGEKDKLIQNDTLKTGINYFDTLTLKPAAYIRFVVLYVNGNLSSEDVSIDMNILKYM